MKGDRKVLFVGQMGHSRVNVYGLGLFGKANIHPRKNERKARERERNSDK
jgi:hypothetical protein